MLNVGDRIWVNIPKTGYVAVGEVTGDICRAEQYQFPNHENQTLLELNTKGVYEKLAEFQKIL
jgi:hypothetical protein